MIEFSDVYIVPQYSMVSSRAMVDTSSILDPLLGYNKIDVPVISANMDSVTDGKMAKAMSSAGAIGALHRFMSIEENVKQYKLTKNKPTLVSVGVSENSKNRAQALYNAGARHFIIDIAHGHSELMENMVKWLREKYKDIYIVGGNVATFDGAVDLISWGVNAIKCGIGPGAVCLTKNVTGVTVPQFTAIRDCVRAADSVNTPITVIADGGIREIGDIAKALGAGADFVMAGSLFASCKEAPLPGIYRGSASKDVMKTVRSDDLPTPEGKSVEIKQEEISVKELVGNIKGGLQSAFSYSNATDLVDFQARCKFGFRK